MHSDRRERPVKLRYTVLQAGDKRHHKRLEGNTLLSIIHARVPCKCEDDLDPAALLRWSEFHRKIALLQRKNTGQVGLRFGWGRDIWGDVVAECPTTLPMTSRAYNVPDEAETHRRSREWTDVPVLHTGFKLGIR